MRQICYIEGGGDIDAVYVKHLSGQDTTYYIHTDFQGSWLVASNDKNSTIIKQSFDPWGRYRNPNDWKYNSITFSFPFERGYCGHEYINALGLINMNGRVYDPVLARFLSRDIIVQATGTLEFKRC